MKILAAALLVSASLTGNGNTQACLDELAGDVKNHARALQNHLDSLATNFWQKVTVAAINQGIELGCGSLTNSMASVHQCLNALAEAETKVTDDGNYTKEWMDLRNRFISLRDKNICAPQSSDPTLKI